GNVGPRRGDVRRRGNDVQEQSDSSICAGHFRATVYNQPRYRFRRVEGAAYGAEMRGENKALVWNLQFARDESEPPCDIPARGFDGSSSGCLAAALAADQQGS